MLTVLQAIWLLALLYGWQETITAEKNVTTDVSQDFEYYDDDDAVNIDWEKDDKLQDYKLPEITSQGDFQFFLYGGVNDRKRSNAKFMVSIRTAHYVKYFGDNHFCAGVIIASKLILTAAHCVVDRQKNVMRPSRLLVVAGTPNRLRRDKTTIEMQVDEVIPHKKFRRRGAHDIAILKLEKGVPMDNDGVKIMPLMSRPPEIGLTCSVLGWGQIYTKGPFSAEVLQASYIIVKADVCMSYLSSACLTGIICGQNKLAKIGDACRGDSGGPLILGETLVGIISQGFGCGANMPTIFTDVYAHRKWIDSVSATAVRHKLSLTLFTMLALFPLLHILLNRN